MAATFTCATYLVYRRSSLCAEVHPYRLSTRKREKYRKPYSCNKCSQCFVNVEDENHIIQCQINSRKLLRQAWITDLSTFLSGYHTPLAVKDTILSKATSWLYRESNQLTTEYDSQSYLDDAISMQDKIGWDHFVRGRLAIEWGRVINIHLHSINNDKYTAEQWATELIKINYQHVLSMWELRNKEEHGVTSEDVESKKKQRLLQEVKHIQESSINWITSDQRYLPESFNELATKSSRQLDTWLINARMLYQVHRREKASIQPDASYISYYCVETATTIRNL